MIRSSTQMFQRVLKKFREKIRDRQFVVTLHAVEELEDEGLSVLDLEHAILTGEIATRQKDADTREWKYLIKGRSLSDDELVVVGKLSPTDKLLSLLSMTKQSHEASENVCDICGRRGAIIRHVTRSYGKGA